MGDKMRIKVLNPYRGVSTNEVLIDRGVYEDGQLSSGVIAEMVALGFAVIEEPDSIPEPTVADVTEPPVKARRRVGK